jgi:hypothetical protein
MNNKDGVSVFDPILYKYQLRESQNHLRY